LVADSITTPVDTNGRVILTGLTYFGNDSFTLRASALLYLFASHTINIEATAPTQQDRAILFSNVTTNSMTVKWTKGNGTNRILVMKQGSAFGATIPSGIYQVGSAFGANDGIVIYNGTASEVAVGPTQPANLTTTYYNANLSGTYYFKVMNYNNPASPAYCRYDGSFNPRSRATLTSKEDVAPKDELTEADINDNSFFVGNINPNPAVNNISFKMTKNVEMNMTVSLFDATGREVARLIDDLTQNKGTDTYSFNLGNNLSSGTYLLVVSSGDQTAVQSFSVVK